MYAHEDLGVRSPEPKADRAVVGRSYRCVPVSIGFRLQLLKHGEARTTPHTTPTYNDHSAKGLKFAVNTFLFTHLSPIHTLTHNLGLILWEFAKSLSFHLIEGPLSWSFTQTLHIHHQFYAFLSAYRAYYSIWILLKYSTTSYNFCTFFHI